MENFLLGFKALFRVWGDRVFAQKVKDLFEDKATAAPGPVVEHAAGEVLRPKLPGRSEALTLLSVLQREARFVDFIKEPIAGYTDAQIGAAARTVHTDCGAVLDRLFVIAPLRSEAEGAEIPVPKDYDPAEFRLVGNIPDHAPSRGKLQHPGWRAAKAEVPEWNGREEAALIVAPCEVEIK